MRIIWRVYICVITTGLCLVVNIAENENIGAGVKENTKNSLIHKLRKDIPPFNFAFFRCKLILYPFYDARLELTFKPSRIIFPGKMWSL